MFVGVFVVCGVVVGIGGFVLVASLCAIHGCRIYCGCELRGC